MKKIFFIIVMISLFTQGVFGESRSDEFYRRLKETYSFDPGTLSREEQKEKIEEIENFWDFVKKNRRDLVPLLEKELLEKKQQPYFYYSGSLLLMSLEHDRKSLETIIIALEKCDLRYVHPLGYFKMVHWIGYKGINTWPAVKKMILLDSFMVYVPEHSLTMNHHLAVVYSLFSQNESYYIPRLGKMLQEKQSDSGTKAIIWALAYTVTPEGQRYLREFNAGTTSGELKKFSSKFLVLQDKKNLPKKKLTTSRKDFRQFLNDYLQGVYSGSTIDVKKYRKDAFYHVEKGDYDIIKHLRNSYAKHVSDEALYKIHFLTLLMQYAYTAE